MSEVEHRVGKLVNTGKSLETYLEGIDIPAYYNDLEDYLINETDNIVFEGCVWEVKDDTHVDPYEKIFEAERVDENTIEYNVRYYNGGCGEYEAIMYALAKLNT